MLRSLRPSPLFPYTTLFRSEGVRLRLLQEVDDLAALPRPLVEPRRERGGRAPRRQPRRGARSEEHTSELQSPCNLVCRLLLEKKKQHPTPAEAQVLHDQWTA